VLTPLRPEQIREDQERIARDLRALRQEGLESRVEVATSTPAEEQGIKLSFYFEKGSSEVELCDEYATIDGIDLDDCPDLRTNPFQEGEYDECSPSSKSCTSKCDQESYYDIVSEDEIDTSEWISDQVWDKRMCELGLLDRKLKRAWEGCSACSASELRRAIVKATGDKDTRKQPTKQLTRLRASLCSACSACLMTSISVLGMNGRNSWRQIPFQQRVLQPVSYSDAVSLLTVISLVIEFYLC
jgi:hypothetical protein